MQLGAGLSETLPKVVEAKFELAKASSSLLFSPTEVAIIHTSTGVPVAVPTMHLRYCPTLAKKPVSKHDDPPPKQKIDPFENPPPALHIADIPTTDPSHLLVLNKFPIIAHHFILATKSNKKQTHQLEEGDLEATYACLRAWQDGSGSKQKRLFAFFNSGQHSGASQPHRHLQFLPIENMHNGEATAGWDLLMGRMLTGSMHSEMADETLGALILNKHLPFTHFAQSFASIPSGSDLLQMYSQLYRAASDTVNNFVAANPGNLSLHSTDGGDSPFSYNLAMTIGGMAIMPRRAEGTMLRRDDGSEIGFVALNGTTLGGTMMVKRQDEWDELRKRPEVLDEILTAIGIPRETMTQTLKEEPPYRPRV
ncbi:HIT-like protein [Ophiobolus disseminans]|uniref:HIT-like protein n=1 Tax=Ophiobolus disseminans TaxID=1469910 RepID=A0A6A6ZT32_9PLEO|nr:HIT-like protein [Ophiobolus disseminans]